MHEYRFPAVPKNYVGSAWEVSGMKPVTIAFGEQVAPNSHLGLGVPSPDLCHHGGAYWIDRFGHAIKSRYISRLPTMPETTEAIWSMVSASRTLWRAANSAT